VVAMSPPHHCRLSPRREPAGISHHGTWIDQTSSDDSCGAPGPSWHADVSGAITGGEAHVHLGSSPTRKRPGKSPCRGVFAKSVKRGSRCYLPHPFVDLATTYSPTS